MRLVIAEKPSVARDLARVLGASQKRQGFIEGNGLVISWCFGHMAQLADPASYDPAWKSWRLDTLPMSPEAFDVEVRDGAADQMKVLARLLNDPQTEGVVNACDAGREGELIFRYVMQAAGANKPVMRLWISSLTDSAIQQGWKNLRPGTDFDALADAARCRSEADWLVGLNATRALTCACPDPGGVLSVGRVQTPTLAMIVARDREIEAFVPEAFFQVKVRFEVEHEGATHGWQGIWFRPGSSESFGGQTAPPSERMLDKELAESVLAATLHQVGSLQLSDRKKKKEQPPLLYDLTSLQQRANQRYGLSAKRTLEIAQELYEKHKVITYPRTDARYLTPDQVPGLTQVVQGISFGPYVGFCTDVLTRGIQAKKRYVDASEVGDHHAIIPTGRPPMGSMPADHKRVFDLIARRFLAALSEDAWFDLSTLIVHVPCKQPLSDGTNDDQHFRAKGRVCTQEGWRRVDPPTKKNSVDLPNLPAGSDALVAKGRVHEGATRPPRRYNDATLLQFMETAGKQLDDAALKRAMRSGGLGTPATRAAILQTLLDRKYIRRQGKELWSETRGRAVVDAVPVEALRSPELTGRWERRLALMADGKDARTDFMQDVRAYTQEVVDAMIANPPPALADPTERGKSLGDCPVCGKPVRPNGKVFRCDTGRTCAFVVWGTMAKRKISAKMVKALLADGRSNVVKGFKSKAGKPFEAALIWKKDEGRVGFAFEDRPRLKVGDGCPSCKQGRIIQGRTALGCSRWREGCRFVQR